MRHGRGALAAFFLVIDVSSISSSIIIACLRLPHVCDDVRHGRGALAAFFVVVDVSSSSSSSSVIIASFACLRLPVICVCFALTLDLLLLLVVLRRRFVRCYAFLARRWFILAESQRDRLDVRRFADPSRQNALINRCECRLLTGSCRAVSRASRRRDHPEYCQALGWPRPSHGCVLCDREGCWYGWACQIQKEGAVQSPRGPMDVFRHHIEQWCGRSDRRCGIGVIDVMFCLLKRGWYQRDSRRTSPTDPAMC
ncbi:hypothetical protein HYQ46_010626 [Verticillium longisporum]|nr:hypothetical protein HYQ46_010626 [Verticillium longisporum]